MVTRRLRIEGIVQGVGYRDALCREARQRGIRGWVRNRSDGSVEALVHGQADAVEALLAWARRGPPAARVDRVHAIDPEPQDATPPRGFDRRPTV